MAGRPLKFKTVEELDQKIDEYFSNCDQTERPYTITGLALALDTSRETLLNYEARDEYFDTIKRAKLRCQNWVEDNMLINKANSTAAIFNLKNNYGWKDRQEIDQRIDLVKPLLGGNSDISGDDSNEEVA